MARLLLMILACLLAIWAVMNAAEPGRHRSGAPQAEPAVRIDAEPARPVPEDGDGPSASDLAPDAGGAGVAQRMPGPALLPSPQYPDTIAPGAAPEPAPEAATVPASVPASAPASGQRRVTAARVNLRGGPGTDHAVVGAVTQGALVTPLAPEEAGWQHVRTEDGAEGWLSAQFLSAPLP